MNKFLLTLLFLPILAFGQNKKVDVAPFMAQSIKINDMGLSPDGNIIMATNKMLFEVSSMDVPMQLMGDNIQTMDYSADGKLYAASKQKIYNVHTEEEIALEDPTNIIKDMSVKGNRIYLATSKGILIYSINTKKWTQLTSDNCDLASNKIDFLVEDKAKNVWAGTNKGYVKVENNNVSVFSSNEKATAATATDQGLWVATDKFLYLVNNGKQKVIKDYSKLHNGKVNAMAMDKEGRLYVASNSLFRYTPQSGYIEKFGSKEGIKGGSIMHLQVDRSGTVWMGTKNSGVFKAVFAKQEFPELTAKVEVSKPVTCNNDSDAVVWAIVKGGMPPYKFFWNGKESKDNINRNLSAGQYTLEIMDGRGKKIAINYDIKNPPVMVLKKLEVEHSNPYQKTGSILMEVTGGVGNINYAWSKNAKANAKNNFAEQLSNGSYQVAAYDENKCIIEKTIDLKAKKGTFSHINLKKGTVIRLKHLKFKADSSQIVKKHFKSLDAVAEMLKENPTMKIEVGGHTNTIPLDDYCNKLSNDRAQNVANYIIGKGIREDRVSYKGYGKTYPRDRFRTTTSRKVNQRVEIKILSL